MRLRLRLRPVACGFGAELPRRLLFWVWPSACLHSLLACGVGAGLRLRLRLRIRLAVCGCGVELIRRLFSRIWPSASLHSLPAFGVGVGAPLRCRGVVAGVPFCLPFLLLLCRYVPCCRCADLLFFCGFAYSRFAGPWCKDVAADISPRFLFLLRYRYVFCDRCVDPQRFDLLSQLAGLLSR